MSDPGALAPKLDLVLKALNLSRGRLAADLAVNKSMVSRWLSGTVAPSSHNLSQLTLLVAQKRPGFTLLDWDRDLAGLAAQLGVESARPSAPAAAAPASLPFGSVEAARRETDRRGEAYEGFWRAFRPASTQPGVVLRDEVLIRRETGLLRIFWGGAGWCCAGWLLPVMGQLYGMMSDDADDSILFCLLNGVSMPRVDMIDGLVLSNAKDVTDTPTAAACLLERTGVLSGEAEADDARYRAARDAAGRAEDLDPAVIGHLLRDVGPQAFGAGGDMLLRAPLHRSMSRGSPSGGWS